MRGHKIRVSWIAFLLFLAVSGVCPGQVQDDTSADELSNVVEALSTEVLQLGAEMEHLQAHLGIEDRELDLWKRETLLDFRRRDWTTGAVLLSMALAAGVSAIGTGRWIRKNAKDLANRVFVDRMSEFLGLNAALLSEILDEQRLLAESKNKRLLVVSKSAEPKNKDYLRSFFEVLGFDRVTFAVISDAPQTAGMDLLIFNNEDSSIEFDEMESVTYNLKNLSGIQYLYFGPILFSLPETSPSVSAANSRATLYHRLSELLRYARISELIASR